MTGLIPDTGPVRATFPGQAGGAAGDHVAATSSRA